MLLYMFVPFYIYMLIIALNKSDTAIACNLKLFYERYKLAHLCLAFIYIFEQLETTTQHTNFCCVCNVCYQ